MSWQTPRRETRVISCRHSPESTGYTTVTLQLAPLQTKMTEPKRSCFHRRLAAIATRRNGVPGARRISVNQATKNQLEYDGLTFCWDLLWVIGLLISSFRLISCRSNVVPVIFATWFCGPISPGPPLHALERVYSCQPAFRFPELSNVVRFAFVVRFNSNALLYP